MNRLDFRGRHAVITGGASGLGYGIAQRLLASGGGVVLWDRQRQAVEAAARSLGLGAIAIEVDVTQPDSVQAALATTLQKVPKVDALVNSAGISGPNVALADYPIEAWHQVIDVNLNGVFLCCRALSAHMREHGYGRIVNIASVAGKDGNPNASAYSASKAAVIALTKSLGKELSATGVRVNCVTPAAVRTAIFEQMSATHIDFMLSKIPMGRFGTVEEVAAMVSWLCTEECSFSTGAVFDLSGGRSTY